MKCVTCGMPLWQSWWIQGGFRPWRKRVLSMSRAIDCIDLMRADKLPHFPVPFGLFGWRKERLRMIKEVGHGPER